MRKNSFVKNFFGIFLLLTFALSNTPTRALHFLFADHVDYVNHHLSDTKTPQLNTSGIDCHCISNVVISPYAIASGWISAKIIPAYTHFIIPKATSSIFTQPLTFGLRGPPAIIV